MAPPNLQLFISNTYILHEKLGEGGMGQVFRATHRMSGRQVALKRIHISNAQDPSELTADSDTEENSSADSMNLRMTLAQEFQILASLHHPHIVNVLDYGFDDNRNPFFTMELLESPQTFLEAAAEQQVADKLAMLVQLLQALAYLHRRKLLHRDIKPSNILVTRGLVKLLDFGIAGSVGGTKQLAGTVEYMAPELFLGQPPTTAADLYAVGKVAYQMFAGQIPHPQSSRTDFLMEILGPDSDHTLGPEAAEFLAGRSPSSESIDEDPLAVQQSLDASMQPLAPILAKLIERAPQDRYDDAAQVIIDLNRALHQDFPVETVATRESFLQAAEFVGRKQELKVLLTALQQAQAGQGDIILISGESGVGKSRLISELRTRALVRTAAVAHSQATAEAGGNYALWAPVIRALALDSDIDDQELVILKDIAPDLEALLGRRGAASQSVTPQEAQARLHNTVEQLLVRRAKPLVIILEDLHWAGTDSLKLLAHLNASMRRAPVLIVGSYREDEASAALRSMPIASRIRLERLGAAQVAELAESILGPAGQQPELADYLQRHTEGNVFFIVEVLRALAEQSGQLDRIGQIGLDALPEELLTGGMEKLLGRRLSQLDSADHTLLEVAAVGGRQLDLRVLQRAGNTGELSGWLNRCANVAVLETQQGDWQFAHDKLRESLLGDLEPEKRRELHRQLTKAILDVHGQDPSHDAVLAYHFSRGGLPERAYFYFLKAGQSAARLYAVKEAQGHYASAVQELLKLPDTPENRRRRVDTMLLQGGVYMWDDMTDHVVALMTEAETLALSLPADAALRSTDLSRLAKLYFTMGRGYFVKLRQSRAITCYKKARDKAQECGEVSQSSYYSGMIGHALVMQGNMGACTPYLDEAIAWLQPQGRSPEWMRLASFRGLSLVARGRVQEGLQAISETIEGCSDPLLTATWNSYLATAHFYTQDWVSMRNYAARAADICRQINNRFLECAQLWLQGWAESSLGDTESAAKHLSVAAALFRKRGSDKVPALFLVAEADAALHTGRIAESIALAERASTLACELEELFCEGMGQRSWAQALMQQTPPDQVAAQFHIAESVRLFALGEMRVCEAHSLVTWGKIDLLRGDAQAAILNFHRAAAMFGTYELSAAQAHALQLAETAQKKL